MNSDEVNELVRFEIEREGSGELTEISLRADEDLLAGVRRHLGLDAGAHIFERDGDGPLKRGIEGRRNLRLVAHSQRAIDVVVRYDHEERNRRFPPSATVFRVLEWAVGKQGHNLDPVAAAKANLILPGADEPLPRDRAIGSCTTPGFARLVLDLTLKDFTNG